ncbi:4Fe-4S dicluster domain-containing protein [Desulfofundulus kuznetsovii]|jgi:heterodisulfide reductase subunit C|uniref:4Fe-4S dicluster domain-containing protein n=1 Tax=Desulfofundulus kuznetsovii TaxID=58135 RepID=UPI0002E39EF6
MHEDRPFREITLQDLERLDPVTLRTARSCANCGRCGGACLARIRDLSPARVLRLLQLGRLDEVLTSRFLWSCIGCRRCSRCCPQELDVATAVVRLRRLAARHPRATFPEQLLRLLCS